MTLYQPEERKSNKPLWIFLGVGASVIALVTVIILLFVNNSAGNDEQNPAGTDPSGNTAQQDPPAITEFTATTSEDNLVFTVVTESYDNDQWFIEYELADQDRAVVNTGTERSNQFTVETKIGDSAYYRLKVRLTNDEQVSEWSENATVELSEVEGVNLLEPTPAYFDSEWAKGNGGEKNLKEALRIAYSAEEVTGDRTFECLPLNTGTMTPGLLLPPLPSVQPKTTQLGYVLQDYDAASDKATLTYVWC